MGKNVRFCLALLVVAVWVNYAVAQGIAPGFGPGTAVQPLGSSMSLPSFFPVGLPQAVSLADVEVRPLVRVGYQTIGLNFNIPTFSQIDIQPAPIDLTVKDANVWVGAVRVDVDFWRNWFLYASGEGNAKRSVTVFTNDEPTHYYGLTTYAPYEWTGTGLEWWSIDTGIGYKLWPEAAFVLGSRWDHLSLVPGDPRDRAGNPVNVDVASGSERAYSDIRAKVWIPYIGVQFTGKGYSASLLWSPLCDANVKVPLRFIRRLTLAAINTDVEYAFKLRTPANFLEGNFDYQMTVGGALGLGVWFKGTWFRMSGTGEMTQDFRTINSGVLLPLYESQTDAGTYSRSMLAGGLSASLAF